MHIYYLKCNQCNTSFGKLSWDCIYVKIDNREKELFDSHFRKSQELKSFLEERQIGYSEITDFLFGKEHPEDESRKKNFEKLSLEKKAVLEKIVGRASEFICLDCLAELLIDVAKEELVCQKCGSKNIVKKSALVGKQCPKCRKGTVEQLLSHVI